MRPSFHIYRLIAAVAIFLLTACSTNIPADGATNSLSTDTQQIRTFPLDEFIGDFWSGETLDEEERRIQAAEVQFRVEYITQCMHDAGFAFDPYNFPPGIWISGVTQIPTRTPQPWLSCWSGK